jgi:ferric-dicitrate binding protein FerR (iron transport regulator)
MADHQAEELIQKYLDGTVSAEEGAELDRLLRDSAEAAEMLARACRVEALLLRHYGVEQQAERVTEALTPISLRGGGAGGEDSGERRGIPLYRRLGPGWYAAAAALLLIAGAFLLFQFTRPGPLDGPGGQTTEEDKSPAPEPALPHQVVAGRVSLNGVEAKKLPNGAQLQVLGEEFAVLKLPDGTKVFLDPATKAVLHGPAAGLRQKVELLAGSGTFQVHKGDGEFQVETPVGTVTALGTEFTVQLLPPEELPKPKQKGKRDDGLAVSVEEGIVEVEFGRHKFVLAAGESQIFRDEGEPRPLKQTKGVLESVALAAGKIQINKGSGDKPNSVTLPLSPQAKVLIDGKPGQFAQLKPGVLVSLTHSDGGTIIAVRAEGPKRFGPIRSVDVKAGTITLAGKKTESGQSADKTYPLAASVKVVIQGQPATLADIKPGQQATLQLAVDGQTVIQITIGQPKEKGSKK